MSSLVRLRLLPSAKCLYTEPVQVLVDGLRSSQVVTMKARATDDKGVLFHACAVYKADSSGAVDLRQDPSLGGSYTGVEPMGLLWSLRADALHTKFYKSDSRKPHVVRFSVHEGEAAAGAALAEATNERLLLTNGVSRRPIKEGNIRGALFVPPGEGPFPAVLDLYTSGGGLSERRASLLANCGFMVLTMVLYGHDAQAKVTKLHLDYFEEAIQFLRKQPKVMDSGVGVISLSKSGDLALSIATYLPNVKATAWINGCCSNIALPLYYRGSQINSALMYDPHKAVVTESGALNIKHCLHDPLAPENKGSLIPIERATGSFLFVAAEDDLNWDSCFFANQMAEKLRRHGKENFEKVFYPRSGHYLEPPFGPYCPSSFHGVVGTMVAWGGEPKAHATAEVHLWNKIQEFFRTHLVPDAGAAKARL
ncbi:Acyl-coenzyme A thioesterase 1 [Merluccius polli]|uniref:Acyl-coenzyme A thioesterase 1 n=1 Tax=Merluccius polli TaxID=89951 RepID=A0AA47MSY0_MERPO|nr:Acyl-coenzyme A thioesterase 1 [Merluccius polli]